MDELDSKGRALLALGSCESEVLQMDLEERGRLLEQFINGETPDRLPARETVRQLDEEEAEQMLRRMGDFVRRREEEDNESAECDDDAIYWW